MKQFFILAPPRSRTAWLANFLTYGDSFCLHEGYAINTTETLFKDLDYKVVGNSDSTNIFFINEICNTYPEAKFVLIERKYEDVYVSLNSLGLMNKQGKQLLDRSYFLLNQISLFPNILKIKFNEIDNSLKEIGEFCTGSIPSKERIHLLTPLHIEININKKYKDVNLIPILTSIRREKWH